MKVALIDVHAGGHHVPYAAGIARRLLELGDQPLAVGTRRWCAALSGVAAPVPVDAEPGESRDYAERNRHYRRFLADTFAACAAQRADVVHLLYLDGFIEALARVAAPAAGRIVATLHWYPFLGMSIEQPRDALKGLLTLAGLRWLSGRGVRAVAHSAAAVARLAACGVSGATAVPYPNVDGLEGVDPTQRRRMRSALGVDDGQSLLLCFGATRHDKGVDLALAALARVAPSYRLLVAGRPQDFDAERLHRLVAQHGLGERVIVRLGHVPEPDVVGLFSASDAVLLPYRAVFKGQSGPLVTAAAMGIPVIASDVPVLRETVETFGLGRLFRAGDPGDLARALRDGLPRIEAERHHAFAAQARTRAFASRMVGVYRGATLPP